MATKFSDQKQNNKQREIPPVDLDLIAQGVRLILQGIGEDPERAGLQETPQRVAEMYAELTSGMREDPTQHVIPLPGDKHDEMVIVKDISIASLCEHHLAPFVGRCHIAYIPKGGRILGISKLARLCGNVFAATATSGAIDNRYRQYTFRGTETARRDGCDRS